MVKHRIFTLQICKFASNLSIMCCKPSCRMTGVSHPEKAFLYELTGVTKAGVDVQKMEQVSSSVSLTDGLSWVPNIGVWKKKARTASVLAFFWPIFGPLDIHHLYGQLCAYGIDPSRTRVSILNHFRSTGRALLCSKLEKGVVHGVFPYLDSERLGSCMDCHNMHWCVVKSMFCHILGRIFRSEILAGVGRFLGFFQGFC